MNRSLEKNRRIRGEIRVEELSPYLDHNEDELITMLNSSEAFKRTIAANLLVNFKSNNSVAALCIRFQSEKKLYTKIAISDSLIGLQEISYSYLIRLLGKIGNNLETEIPQKGFLKKSYPLPRDVAARTLCRFDPENLNKFITIAYKLDSLIVLEQIIDVIGHMIFSHKLSPGSLKIIGLYEKNQTEMIKYKIIRCLSGIKDKYSEEFLYKNLKEDNKGFQFEIVRSLILSGIGLQTVPDKVLLQKVRDFADKLQKLL
jgi:hypothetical protein